MSNKYEKPVKLDMSFEEALSRVAATDKAEVDVLASQDDKSEPVYYTHLTLPTKA